MDDDEMALDGEVAPSAAKLHCEHLIAFGGAHYQLVPHAAEVMVKLDTEL
jgi:hypothetical protein